MSAPMHGTTVRCLTRLGAAATLVGLLAAAAAAQDAPKPAPAQQWVRPPVSAGPIVFSHAGHRVPPTLVTQPPVAAPVATPEQPPAEIVADPCDPNKDVLDTADTLIAQAKPDEALLYLNRVLYSSPEDFRANVMKGELLYNKAAKNDPVRWNPPVPFSTDMAAGFDTLRAEAARLGRLDSVCVARFDAYAILNTIGALYLTRGYFREAQDYLLMAYKAKDRLSETTRVKVLNNLGLVYLVQLQPDPAIRFYTEARRHSSPIADAQILKATNLKRSLTLPSR
jgi:tetratricopeptide (TPR) repeat protein